MSQPGVGPYREPSSEPLARFALRRHWLLGTPAIYAGIGSFVFASAALRVGWLLVIAVLPLLGGWLLVGGLSVFRVGGRRAELLVYADRIVVPDERGTPIAMGFGSLQHQVREVRLAAFLLFLPASRALGLLDLGVPGAERTLASAVFASESEFREAVRAMKSAQQAWRAAQT